MRLSEDSMNAGLYRMAQELAEEMKAEIIKRTPVEGDNEGGLLRDSYEAEVVQGSTGRFRVKVTGLARGKYPEKGTGIYGKFKTEIVAHTPSGMHFFWKKQGRYIRVQKVKGQPGQHFMERGRDAAVRKMGKRIAKSLLGVK